MIFSHHAIPPISKNKLYSVGKFKVFLTKYCGGQKKRYEAESVIWTDLGHFKGYEFLFTIDLSSI